MNKIYESEDNEEFANQFLHDDNPHLVGLAKRLIECDDYAKSCDQAAENALENEERAISDLDDLKENLTKSLDTIIEGVNELRELL